LDEMAAEARLKVERKNWLYVCPPGPVHLLTQVLDRGAQAIARGAASCALQVLDRGAQVAARVAATLPQLEKNNSKDEKRNRVNITGFICTETRKHSLRCTLDEFESLAVASRRRWRIIKQPLCRLCMRQKISV
jgi:hypothetical protein